MTYAPSSSQVLLSLFRHEPAPTHMAVVVDAPGANFRNALYPQYKAGRAAAPEGESHGTK